MAELATLNGFMAATQEEVPLPESCKELLHRDTVTVCRIPASYFNALWPLLPRDVAMAGPEEDGLTKEERAARFHAREWHWLETIDPERRVTFLLDRERVKFRAVALSLLEPKMTVDQVERLGDDISPVYVRVLEISKLLVTPEPAPSEAAAA